jgi:lipoprotein-anchoring transpeptidase ErfK/SrfK
MRSVGVLALAAVVAGGLWALPAAASTILAQVSISDQTMEVYVDGWQQYSWPVSTARKGYVTPTGVFHAQRLAEVWYSKKYDNSPMPHSIFFNGGYAIHGTEYVKRLGTPASHGCIRLHPENAATLFDLVQENGPESLRFEVQQ